MNILLIAHEKNLGGASKSLITLAGELEKRGNKVIVITPFKTGAVYKELREKQIPVYAIFFGWWMMPKEWNLLMKIAFRILYKFEIFAVSRIVKIAKKCNIQVIHSNSSVIDVGAKAAKKLGIPHVWHFREFGDLDYRLEYLLGKEKSCQFVNSVDGKEVFISKRLYSHYKEWILPEKCKVIYNGIAEQFLFDKYGEGIKEPDMDKPITFLMGGNLHRNKRQDLAIEACEILCKNNCNNFKLIIAGASSSMADSKKYEQELKERVKKNGLQEKIEFTGFVQDMLSLRKNADVEIVCSSMEAFGRVTVEAMMASNPVIASDSGANPELIEDNKNGLLFREGNAEELAAKMKVYLQDPELIQNMGIYAYNYANKKFPSSINTMHLEELYMELCN